MSNLSLGSGQSSKADHHLHGGELSEVLARDGGHVGAQLDRDSRASEAGQRKRGLAGAAADLQHPCPEASVDEDREIIEQPGWISGAAAIVAGGVFAEGCPQSLPIKFRHGHRLLPHAGQPRCFQSGGGRL